MTELTRPEQVAAVLIATFAGRDDAYPAWDGREYTTVHAPLTPAVVVTALTSPASAPRPVSAFFLTPDSRTHVGALDLDRPDGWELARGLGSEMWAAGIFTFAEESRDGRAHLWLSIVERVPAILVRRALLAFLQAAGLADAKDIELRPKQDRIQPDRYGNGLRLPTMPNKNTGKRYPLCDPRTGAPLGKTLSEMLLAVELTPVSAIASAAERWRAPQAIAQPAIRRDSYYAGDSPIDRFNAAVGVSQVLRREWGAGFVRDKHQDVQPGKSIRCPAHTDDSPSLSIAKDDARVWCHSPACDLHGADGQGHDAYSLWQLAQGRAA